MYNQQKRHAKLQAVYARNRAAFCHWIGVLEALNKADAAQTIPQGCAVCRITSVDHPAASDGWKLFKAPRVMPDSDFREYVFIRERTA